MVPVFRVLFWTCVFLGKLLDNLGSSFRRCYVLVPLSFLFIGLDFLFYFSSSFVSSVSSSHLFVSVVSAFVCLSQFHLCVSSFSLPVSMSVVPQCQCRVHMSYSVLQCVLLPALFCYDQFCFICLVSQIQFTRVLYCVPSPLLPRVCLSPQFPSSLVVISPHVLSMFIFSPFVPALLCLIFC